MSFEIFTDSAANLPDDLRIAHNINVIPFFYLVNGKEYLCLEEGVPFRETAKQVYAQVRAGAEIKTSLIGEQRYVDAITPSLQAGKDVLIITIASGISGTYAQALEAQKQLQKDFPERTIVVRDSANASLGQGLLVLKAASLREMGESLESCAKWLDDNTYCLNSYLTVGDLKYLRRSGRISSVTAIAGAILNIKPIIKADGGHNAKLVIAGREHGRKKALGALVTAFRENVINPENQTIAIAHAECEEEALALAETLKGLGAREVIVEYYDICSGVHAGPGTLAVFFLGKDRKAPAAATAPIAKPAFHKAK